MLSELIWGMVVAASAIAAALVVLPMLERWSGPPIPAPSRSAIPGPGAPARAAG
jgi:hypothetical protein